MSVLAQIDQRYDSALVRQFASQFQKLDESSRLFLGRMLGGNESPDFYAGLIAGLANAYQLSRQDRSIGLTLSAVCDLVESKELLTDTPVG